MTSQENLLDRLREALRDHNPREVSMFGGISFMIDDRILVAARRDGELLVHIDPATSADALAQPGARPAMMGADRPMGDGWVSVEPAALEGPRLEAWLHRAFCFHAG